MLPIARRLSPVQRWLLAILAALALLAGVATWGLRQWLPPPATAGTLDPRGVEAATALLDHLDAGRWDAAHATLAPAAAAALDADQLRGIWTALPAQLGGPAVRGAPRGEVVGDTPVTTHRLAFPNAALDARVVIDAEGRITGFRLVPAAATPVAPAPPPADAAFTERELEVAGLPGTLSVPRGDGPFPAVVLVHGSGPNDRDETIGPVKVFRDLAHGLASRGIVVLRYDKRSLVAPEGMPPTVDGEATDDAVAAVALLATLPEVDASRIAVAGHSLGAMLTPRILARAPAASAGVMLAAPARPLDVIVRQQMHERALDDGETSAAEAAMLADLDLRLARLAAVRAGDAPDGPLPLDAPAPWWASVLAVDPVADAAAIDAPLLVVHGGRDIQVRDEDFALYEAAFAGSPRVTLARHPALDHRLVAGEGPGSIADYARPGEVDAALVEQLAGVLAAPR